MKIGILTWWRNNYGSVLQAYALEHTLNRYDGVQCEIICQFGKTSTSFDNVWDKLKSVGVVETFKRAFWKVSFGGLRRRTQKMQQFVDSRLIVSEQQYTEQTIAKSNECYDAFLCGSDQIWNPDLSPTSSMYWLGFVKSGKKKIAYAPSFGAKEVSWEQKIQIRENLRSFTAISCREASGAETLNAIMRENRCVPVLDPTMLIERKFWDDISGQPLYKERYVFAYMLRGTKKQRQFIEKFARQKGLKVISIPFLDWEKIDLYDLKFGDEKLWDANPAEFISAIRHAEYVFCDSFHGMVFSILYHRPFYIFPKVGKDGKIKETQLCRITDLLILAQIPDRIVKDDVVEGRAVLPDAEIDWNLADKAVEGARQASEFFLRNALFLQ